MSESQPSSLPVRSVGATPNLGSGAMFDAIAHRYDLLNRIMSFGVDMRWRKLAIHKMALQPGAKVLDLATGTADMALLVHRLHPQAQVVGLDPSRKMLDVGEQKVQSAGAQPYIRLEQGDAQALPFEAAQFDAACMAFGIRNVPDRSKALRELARVVKPGGRICILELSEPQHGLLALGARFYIHHLVPRIGGLLSGSREYRYLQQSIAQFPQPEAFAAIMRAAGLEVLEVLPLMFGSCQLFVATPGGRTA